MNGKIDIRGATAGRSVNASQDSSAASAKSSASMRDGTQDPRLRSRRQVQILRLRSSISGTYDGEIIRIYGVHTSSTYLAANPEGRASHESEGRTGRDGLRAAPGTEAAGDAGSRAQTRRTDACRTSATGCCLDGGTLRIPSGTAVAGQAQFSEEACQAQSCVGCHLAAKIATSRDHSRRDGSYGDDR
jgi:hypothetical protein